MSGERQHRAGFVPSQRADGDVEIGVRPTAAPPLGKERGMDVAGGVERVRRLREVAQAGRFDEAKLGQVMVTALAGRVDDATWDDAMLSTVRFARN